MESCTWNRARFQIGNAFRRGARLWGLRRFFARRLARAARGWAETLTAGHWQRGEGRFWKIFQTPAGHPAFGRPKAGGFGGFLEIFTKIKIKSVFKDFWEEFQAFHLRNPLRILKISEMDFLFWSVFLLHTFARPVWGLASETAPITGPN